MANKELNVKLAYNGKDLIIETGLIAKQANGSVIVRHGNNVFLVTACCAKAARAGADFFPLTVDFIEKMYAAGKIPGGFFKREARPSTDATLKARQIDRPIRPLFPAGFRNDVNIVVTSLSYDGTFPSEVLGIIGASAALCISNIPFDTPVGGVVIGLKNGEFIINPPKEDLANSTLELSISGTKSAIMMVEARAGELSEEKMLEALLLGHDEIRKMIDLQEQLIAQIKPKKMEVVLARLDEKILATVRTELKASIEKALHLPAKLEKYSALDQLKQELLAKNKIKYAESEWTSKEQEYTECFEAVEKEVFRRFITEDNYRDDGRSVTQIRQLSGQVGWLPCVHGSALFTRGETQTIATTTLGTKFDEQIIDNLDPEEKKTFFLHYNFPPYSVGETGAMRSPGRRELGHGNLAERALSAILPVTDAFPYTIRIVSDITESNGSSSMATICGGCLSLMDAGVPIKAPVAGIAMGLIKEGEKYTILTDIAGIEDHLGDMDFKVAGTRDGITALQMDIKITGVTKEIMSKALAQAKIARMELLNFMDTVIATPRAELSKYAPRLVTIQVKQDQIGMIIGPGGKMIRSIIDASGAQVDIDDDGRVVISSIDASSLQIAKDMIENLVREVGIGEIYDGRVVSITNFGAFVEILPGKEGLLHISQISEQRINRVEDVLAIGDSVKVRVRDIDDQKRISLTAKGF